MMVRLGPPLFILLVAVAFFRDGLFTSRVLYFRDLFSLFIPARRLITGMVQDGIAPWWNPYLFSGIPLAADVVHGIFYPLSAIFYFLPIHWGFKVFVVVHYLIAGVAFFSLMRHWRVPRLAATFGAVTFMLSGYLLSLSNVLNFLPGAAWLPLTLLCFVRAVEPAGWRWVVPTGVTLALQAFADPQSVYFAGFLLGLWALFPNGAPWGRFALRVLGVIGASGIIAALVSAVQLLPLLELYPQSIRAEGVSLAMSLVWSFRPSRLLEFLIPGLYGDVVRGTYWGWIFQKEFGAATPWLLSAYVGVAPLVLAGVALGIRWKDRLVRFASVGFILALFLALGDSTPLYPMFYKVLPFFTLFRFPSKWLLIATFSLSTLAALGLAGVAERSLADARRIEQLLRAGLLGSLGLALGLGGLALNPGLVGELLAPHFPPEDLTLLVSYLGDRILRTGMVGVGLLVCTLLLLYAGRDARWPARLAGSALLLLLTGDLLVHNAPLAQFAPREVLAETEPPLARLLKQDSDLYRVYRLDTREEDEFIVGRGRSFFDLDVYRWRRSSLYVNTGMDHGISEFWGASAVRLKDYERIRDLAGRSPLDLRLLGAWNVKYIIAPLAELRHELLEPVPVPGDSRVRVYLNRDFLPRAFWVPQARWLKDREDLFRALTEFDPGREVLLEGVAGPPVSRIPAEARASVQILRYQPNRVVVRCEAPVPGFLVLADTYYPGWRATVNGADRPLLRANYAMRAVRLEAGTNEISFLYEPGSVKIGGLISLLALVLFGGLMVPLFVRGAYKQGQALPRGEEVLGIPQIKKS